MTDFPSSPEFETLLGNLPLQYIDGPDFCTVKDATGGDFALTVQPELMQMMERALLDLAQSSRDRQAIAAQIREYLQKKYGTYAVQVSSDGVERIYYNGVSLLDLADALSISSPDRGGKA